jgi:hypothetical protein
MDVTYILTITDIDGEILFQQIGDEAELESAAVQWMQEQYPDYFATDRLADAGREGYDDDYDYIVHFTETIENAPHITIRPADVAES